MDIEARDPGRLSPVSTTSMSRRAALRRLGLAGASTALLAAAWTQRGRAAQEDGPPAGWFAPEATVGPHGMVIVGEGPVYFSHMPEFMFGASQGRHPHHYQVIAEVTLPHAALETYLADRQETGAPLYTLRPREYAMLDLIQGVGGSALQTIEGDIIRGHWERSKQPQPFGITWDVVAGNVSAAVERIVYAHEFSFQPPDLGHLEYILYGEGEQLYLTHRITQPPDFDQTLPVTLAGGIFPAAQLQAGIIVAIPQRANSFAERLMAGDEVVASARIAGTGIAVAPLDPGTNEPLAGNLVLEAGPELFFEEGELGFSFDPTPTQAEIDAGFAFP